jgi:hypothetical protein
MPVYAIIATGIASAKFDHVGATPRWMLLVNVCGLKISAKPTATSSSCVVKSSTARKTLRLAASLIPTMFRVTSSHVQMIPTMMSHGFVRSGSQKIER